MNDSTTINNQTGERFSTVTRKGQVTVPADVRMALGLNVGDKVAFIVDKNNMVEFKKKESIVAQTAGILASNIPPITTQQLREEAERGIAEEVMRRSA